MGCDGGIDRLEQLFGVLSHPVRRQLLTRVYERRDSRSGEVRVTDLLADDDVDCRATALHHVHLPKLTAAGYVDWRPSDGVVRPGERFPEFVSVVELFDEHGEELPYEWP